ncbi:MAG: HEPN domain-containing protein [Gammaproteobacteria bacterium]
MPVSNRDFLLSAQSLITNRNEIDFRNAASRAYYAAFHGAKSLIDNGIVELSKNPIRKNKGTHEKLILDLHESNDTNVNEIAQLLKSCKNERAIADYNLSHPFERSRAEVVIGLASEILLRVRDMNHDLD